MSFFNTQKELKNYMHIQGMHSFLNLGQNSVSIVGAWWISGFLIFGRFYVQSDVKVLVYFISIPGPSSVCGQMKVLNMSE